MITLEPMPPNFSGVNALYSREFYELAATRLTPGGVVAQWLPFHLLAPDHSASIAATFVAVFADSILWIDPTGGTGILLGRVAGAPEPLGASWPGLARRSAARPLGEDQIRAGVFLSGETFDRYASQGAVITDDNQLLEFSRMRPGTRGRRQKWLFGQNYRVLNEVGGRLPLLVRSRRRPKSG